jgi:DNA-directed RNA polymerase I subunit RPA49
MSLQWKVLQITSKRVFSRTHPLYHRKARSFSSSPPSRLTVSVEEAKAKADSTRLIPQYDADALNPNDVYPLHNMIPKSEWKALSISAYLGADGNAARIALLPFKRSNWINDHMSLAFASPTPNKTNMCVDVSFIITAH